MAKPRTAKKMTEATSVLTLTARDLAVIEDALIGYARHIENDEVHTMVNRHHVRDLIDLYRRVREYVSTYVDDQELDRAALKSIEAY